MGTFIKHTIVLAFVLALSTLIYRNLAVGSNGVGDDLSNSKKITVVVLNLSDVPPATSAAIEERVGQQDVAPYLIERGYNVENVFSFAQLMDRNGGIHRALINAFESEPGRDSARILMVTLQAQPGVLPNTVSTAFALLDTQVSGLLRARKLGIPAPSKHIWAYELPPDEALVETSYQGFKSKLRLALKQYDQQFLQKLESDQYPPVPSL